MYSHIMIGSNDIARSKKFYDALFVAMGAQPATPRSQRLDRAQSAPRVFHLVDVLAISS